MTILYVLAQARCYSKFPAVTVRLSGLGLAGDRVNGSVCTVLGLGLGVTSAFALVFWFRALPIQGFTELRQNLLPWALIG